MGSMGFTADAKDTSREQCRLKYGRLLEDIMNYICARKHDNLFLHENGLLYANGKEKAVTWMNSTVNGHPVILAPDILLR